LIPLQLLFSLSFSLFLQLEFLDLSPHVVHEPLCAQLKPSFLSFLAFFSRATRIKKAVAAFGLFWLFGLKGGKSCGKAEGCEVAHV
jgi:hypothetical protein